METVNEFYFTVSKKFDGYRVGFSNKDDVNSLSFEGLINFNFDDVIVFNKKKYRTLKRWVKAQIKYSEINYPRDVAKLKLLITKI